MAFIGTAAAQVGLAIVGKITEFTVEPIGRQLGYICFYKKYIDELNVKINERILPTRDTVQASIRVAERNREDIAADVRQWLSDADKILEKKKELEGDKGDANAGCCTKWSCLNLWSQHQLGRKAQKLMREIDDLYRKRKTITTISHPKDPQQLISSFTTGYLSYNSRETKLKEIMDALTSTDVNVIGVHGFAGVGKTTLVREVAKRAKVDNLFDVVVFAEAKQNPDVKQIQKQIADMLGLKLEDENERARAARLLDRLKQEKRILVILDDLWEGIDLNILGIPLGDDQTGTKKLMAPKDNIGDKQEGWKVSKNSREEELPIGDDHTGTKKLMAPKDRKMLNIGDKKEGLKNSREEELLIGDDHKVCKILMTSRDEGVLSEKMGSEKNILVGTLEEEEARELFNKMAKLDDSDKNYNALLSIADEVAEHCKMLPIAIVAVASALRGKKSLSEWKDASRQLKRQAKGGDTEIMENVYSSFQFSYDYLRGPALKSTFLLCALMGHNVSFMDLLKYCLGLDLLQGCTGIEEARDSLYSLIDKLKASCLLLDGNFIDSFTMHDLVREFALLKVAKQQHVFGISHGKLDKWPDANEMKNIEKIYLEYNDINKLPDELKCPKLQFFYVGKNNPSLKIPPSFFTGMQDIKVLHFTGMHLSSVPSSIEFLRNLWTLRLERCELEDITLIGRLENLKILSLCGSVIKCFPCEIGKLIQLQFLDLSDCRIEQMASQVLSRLEKLEELYMRNSRIDFSSLGDLSGLHSLKALEIHIRDVGLLSSLFFFENLRRYKILVGDEWNWYGKFAFSRTLKLKLKTNIHSGIKMLLKTVEELSLGEVGSVRSVLDDMNEDGFPHLTFLDIQNNSEIQYIVDSSKWIELPNAFPMLESLVLHKLINLESIWHGQITTALFYKLRIIKVDYCDRLKSLISLSMVGDLSQLMEIDVSECNFMEEIVRGKEMNDGDTDAPVCENEVSHCRFLALRSLTLRSLPMLTNFYFDYKNYPSSRRIKLETETRFEETIAKEELGAAVPLFNKVTFPNLETIRLNAINLVKIWDDKFSATFYFQNLSSLIIEKCANIEHLFSLSMATSLVELKYLEISECEMMVEILQLDKAHFNNEVVFPKLETVHISKIENLRSIWNDYDFAPKSFGKLKTMEIRNCYSLVTIFPSYRPEIFQSLETLEVQSCYSVEEIFDLQGLINSREIILQLKVLVLSYLLELKHVWNNKDSHGVFKLPSLSVVKILNCNRLRHVFSTSVAKDLPKLEKLQIDNCNSLEEIVEGEAGEQAVEFELPQLTSIELSSLYSLRSFYGGDGGYILKCPQLKSLRVNGCPKAAIFTKEEPFQQVHNQGRRQQPFFSVEKVIPKLEELALSEDQVEIVKHRSSRRGLFTNLKLLTLQQSLPISKNSLYCSWFLEQKPNLEELALKYCSCKEILFFEVIDNKESDTVRVECPKKLTLDDISNIKYIFKKGSRSQLVQIQNLQHLNVLGCYSLIGLAQGLVSLNHLKYLEICECDNLKSLVTSSTAKSFVQLTSLKISSCPLITNIVADEDEAVCDSEITFSKLELLELNLLPGLESFCLRNHGLKFPLLKSMFVIQCPEMKTFTPGNSISTPQLRRVDVHKIEDAWFWEGDLNATIHKLFTDMVAFHGIEDLLLFKYPMLKDVWNNGQGPLKLFKLKQLIVWNCEFVSSAILSPTLLQSLNNLEVIRVDNWDSVVQVFDLEGLGIDGHLGLLPRLKELQLGSLPNLTHIWSKEAHGILDLKNLISLTICECHSLRNLFNSSMVSGLMGLQEMKITDCNGIEEIITKASSPDDVAASIGSKIIFPRLNVIVLKDLPNLTCFYSGSETLECPSLKSICKENCPQMKAFDMIEAPNTSISNISNSKISFPKLEVLELGFNDWSLQLPEACCSNIKLLKICTFGQALSPMGPIWRFRNLEQLHLEEIYNVEELNPCEEEVATDAFSKLEKLFLSNLPKLRTSLLSLAPSFENLTVLVVSYCDELLSVGNSSVATSLVRLTYLKVRSCEKMTEIIASDEGGEAEKEQEIVFHRLKILILVELQSLARFSSGNHTIRFPILEMVVVQSCPEMESFSCGLVETPQLKRVQVEGYYEDYFDSRKLWEKKLRVNILDLLIANRKLGEDKWIWVDNLNTTIQKLYSFTNPSSFNYFRLSKHPELKDIWQDGLLTMPLSTLKSLAVDNCEFVTHAIPISFLKQLNRLEYLLIENCSSLEQVFDLSDFHKNIFPLLSKVCDFRLVGLPKLKNIWSTEPRGVHYFIRLQILKIDDLSSLPNAFTLSMIEGLFQLRMIEIVNCNNVEEIITEARDDAATIDRIVRIHSLESIVLKCLPNLLSFYSGSATLECLRLQKITLIGCPKMKTFSSTFSIIENETIDNQQSGGKSKRNQKQGEGDVSTTPIINGESTFPVLYEFILGYQDAMTRQFSEQFYDKVIVLQMQCADNSTRDHTSADFPSELIKRMHNLKEIHITDGFIEEIIHSRDKHNSCVSQSENLDIKFSKLFKLKHLWQKNSQPDPIVQASETLDVRECDKLNTLLPSFVSFKNLRTLKVSECNGLMNLLSNSTITKGLVQLTFLYVTGCKRMTEVIANGGGELEDEIVFTHLEMLILYNLPTLTGFCSRNYTIRLPNLEKVVVCECPEMKIFSSGVVISKRFKKFNNDHLHFINNFEIYCAQILEENQIDEHWEDSDNLNIATQRMFSATREKHEGEEHEEGKGSEEKPEKKASTQNLAEKVNLFCGQDQSRGTEYDSKETPDATLPKETREPKSKVIVPTVGETKSPEAETSSFESPTITNPRGLGLGVDSNALVQDDDRAHISPPIDPPMTKPAHASEGIFPSQVNKLTSTSAQSPETISKEDQIPTIDDLQGKERVIPVYEESSEPSGSNLPVQRMHNLPQPETLVSSKVTTSSKNLEPSVKMVDFQGGQCQVDESFLPLLEQACDKMPHLLECQKRYSARFSCCAFSCLGQVLFLLRNMKIKDMVNHKDELELFWEEAKAMKFDLEWLSPAVKRALSTTLVEEVSKICELQKEVQMFEDKIAAAKMEIASLDAKIDVAKMEIASLETKMDVAGYFF